MACQEAVLKFLDDHNRPFSNSDIQQGVQGDFGKAAIQKALDFLVQKEKVKEKIYGKQKVYCIVQNSEKSSTDLRESLLEIDRSINEKSSQLKELGDEYKSKVNMISELKGLVSIKDALEQNVKLDKEIRMIKEKLAHYEGSDIINPESKRELLDNFNKYKSEYEKRKRLCNGVLDAILENYPKSKKQLYDDVGLETDEDAGFSAQLEA